MIICIYADMDDWIEGGKKVVVDVDDQGSRSFRLGEFASEEIAVKQVLSRYPAIRWLSPSIYKGENPESFWLDDPDPGHEYVPPKKLEGRFYSDAEILSVGQVSVKDWMPERSPGKPENPGPGGFSVVNGLLGVR